MHLIYAGLKHQSVVTEISVRVSDRYSALIFMHIRRV